jgi:ankyrin repeat protein
LVERLLAAGADVNVRTFRGETPLKLASRIGANAVVDLLRRAGAEE